MSEHTPDPIDVHVGNRIRVRRKQLDQSQSALAKALGISFQQVQKYERGGNRISASMMYRAAAAQEVEVAYFFDGLGILTAAGVPEAAKPGMAWLASAEAWPVAQAMAALPPHLRKAVLTIAESLAGVS